MSPDGPLRVVQGICLLAGGLLAALSVGEPTVSGVSTVDAGLVALALGFVAAAGAESAGGRRTRTALSLLAAGLFVVVAAGSGPVALAGSVLLLPVGAVLLADSVTALRDRQSA